MCLMYVVCQNPLLYNEQIWFVSLEHSTRLYKPFYSSYTYTSSINHGEYYVYPTPHVLDKKSKYCGVLYGLLR